MRHDYRHPQDWDSMTDAEKAKWYTQRRCQRQAMQQDTPGMVALRQRIKRLERRLEARSETESVDR